MLLNEEFKFENWFERQLARAKSEQIIVQGVQIMPENVMTLMQKNDHNRQINNVHVSLLAKSIRSGDWVDTGDTIKFDPTGRLIDGQHRLMAVKIAGKPVRLNLAFGVPFEAFDRIDVGRNRTASDLFSMSGYSHCHILAGAARTLIAINGGYHHVNPLKVTKHELLSYVKTNPDLHHCAKICMKIQSQLGKVGSSSGITAGIFLIRKVIGDIAKGNEFFHLLETGVSLSETNAILALRNRCIRSDNRKKTRAIGAVEQAALLVKAWNYWSTGRPTKSLTWRTSDEMFPVVAP